MVRCQRSVSCCKHLRHRNVVAICVVPVACAGCRSDVTSNLYPLDLVESTGDLLRRESELKRKTESGSAATSASKKLVEDASAAAPTGNKAQEDSGLWSRIRAGVRTALVGRDWQWEEAPSALSAAVEHEQRDILTLPRVKGLLDKKWRKFAYRRFINTFISSGVFVALFTVAVIMRTELGRNTASFRSSCGASTPAMVVAENTTLNCTVGLDALPAPLGSAIGNAVDAVAAVSPFNITRLNILPFDRTNFDPAEIFRYPWLCGRELFWECAITTLLELVVLVGAVWRLLGDLRRAARIGFREYFKLRGAGTLLNVPPVTGCACILIGFALDLLDGNYDGVLHRMFLSLAALSMYAYCTSFLLAFVQTGPFVVRCCADAVMLLAAAVACRPVRTLVATACRRCTWLPAGVVRLHDRPRHGPLLLRRDPVCARVRGLELRSWAVACVDRGRAW